MTVTLELSDDIEEAIERKARRLGITSNEYLRRMAERAARPARSVRPGKSAPSGDRPKTGAELLAELDALNIPPGYGDPSIDSPELARQLRDRFARRDHSHGESRQ